MAFPTIDKKPAHSAIKLAGKPRVARAREEVPVNLTRQEFFDLPLAQRRKILHAQALTARAHYEQSADWRDWEAADLTSAANE
ncbi:MAG: hypothetical protein HY043_14585 [Verrucomicrobia bacterium]|nr:hypothetical protein [Verrucomicrobiota bacterium]